MSIPTKSLLRRSTLPNFSFLIIIPIFCLILTVIASSVTEVAASNRELDRAATPLGRCEKELAEFKKAVTVGLQDG